MASGCPVINARIPGSGVPWVSRDEESGLTVPINDPIALAEAARSLISDDALHERLSNGGRARAVDDFDHTIMARRSVQIYHRALLATDKYVPSLPANGILGLPRQIEATERARARSFVIAE